MASISMISLDDLAEPDWRPESVTARRNALGLAPERVLFLWPFARPMNLRAQVIGHGWAQIGPVHLLLRPGWGLMRWVLRSMDEVYDELDGFSGAPGRQKAPQMRFGDGVWRPYHGYPVNPLTVDEAIWEEVIEVLVDRCSLFVADMTAKKPSRGLAFELSFLLSSVPDRLVLLVDSAKADVEVCRALVEDCRQGAGGSPPPLFLYDSQTGNYVLQAFKGAFGGKATLPIAAKALRALGWG